MNAQSHPPGPACKTICVMGCPEDECDCQCWCDQPARAAAADAAEDAQDRLNEYAGEDGR